MDAQMFKLYGDRLTKFFRNLKDDIFEPEEIAVKAEYARTAEPVPFSDRLKLKYRPVSVGQEWGRDWECAWFHLQADLPAAWRNRKVTLVMNLSGESLIYDHDGTPLFGLTGFCSFESGYTKTAWELPEEWSKSGKLDCYVDAGANLLFGLITSERLSDIQKYPHGHHEATVSELHLALRREDVYQFYKDVEILLDLMKGLPEHDYRRKRMTSAMNNAINRYGYNPANAAEARKELKPVLNLPAMKSAMTAVTTGHAHLDTGWLWPVRESVRKASRTFSSQINLMEKYPDYIFGASSAQHYQFVRDTAPGLYEKIKARIREGRWEIQGGMWVEADCNLPDGESLVRQFLHGKNYFMDEFGVDVKNLWIPDVFGYSAALPQIIRKSGCDSFLTQKLSWCQVNKFPHQTFIWEGIDGSSVLTHFPPENSYNSRSEPSALMQAQDTFVEGDKLDEFISLIGIGDGAGGPTEEFVERSLRLRNLEGVPRVKFGRVDAFFKRLSRKTAELSTWVGELYFELHRGTLTTQAQVKKANRQCEQLLNAVEFVYSLLPADSYPKSELKKLWETVLLNQFHDILPGSSIHRVYIETAEQHSQVLKTAQKLLDKAVKLLSVKAENTFTLLNTTSEVSTRLVELPVCYADREIFDESGAPVPTQFDGEKLLARTTLYPHRPMRFSVGGKKAGGKVKKSAVLVLENDLVRYEFAPNAELVRAFDKEFGRELLKAGQNGNQLRLYHDLPNNFEAWDVDFFYREMFIGNVEAAQPPEVKLGELRSSIRFELKIGSSTLTQLVTLDGNSKELDFATEADWNETRKLLRAEFPLDIRTEEAGCDIQYGFIHRPTHSNNSFDAAKFEVCCHRYADLSEPDYGVALLNDCKYGYRVNGGGLELSLLRSQVNPDSLADKMHHSFTYALLPHSGALIESDVQMRSAALNRAPVFIPGTVKKCAPLTETDYGVSCKIAVEKAAEKSGDVIVRLAETQGRRGTAKFNVSSDFTRVEYTNLIEWEKGAAIPIKNGRIEVTFSPFELITLRLKRK